MTIECKLVLLTRVFILVFLHFKNANTIHYKNSLYSIDMKKNVHKMSSGHGASVLTGTGALKSRLVAGRFACSNGQKQHG